MKKDRIRRLTKFVASAIVGVGTTKIVSQIIANNIDTPEKTADKVEIAVASAVVGTMAVEQTKSWTNAKIDLFFDRWDKAGSDLTESTDQQ
jgi:hypothetical protein